MAGAPALDHLLAARARFRAFLVARLGNEADADEILQAGLVRALARSDTIRDGERVTAWFFQVLRNAVADHVRSRRAAAAREKNWQEQAVLGAGPEAERSLCGCVEALVAALKPREAEILRRVELGGEPVGAVAESLGLTANHAGVVLHRARRRLRDELVRFCGDCARGACLDCDCPPPAPARRPGARTRP